MSKIPIRQRHINDNIKNVLISEANISDCNKLAEQLEDYCQYPRVTMSTNIIIL